MIVSGKYHYIVLVVIIDSTIIHDGNDLGFYYNLSTGAKHIGVPFVFGQTKNVLLEPVRFFVAGIDHIIKSNRIQNPYTVINLSAIINRMGKGIVYIAMSLDGYIATKKGSVDRLNDFPNSDALEYGYPDLIAEIDTILMGKNTYVEILKLKEDRPYDNCATYVMSRDPDLEIKTPNTQILNGLSPETVIKLHAKSEKNIWILGGGLVVSQCLEIGAVDEMVISVLPVLLGKGIPLFTNMNKKMGLDLVKTESFDTGIVILHYQKKETIKE